MSHDLSQNPIVEKLLYGRLYAVKVAPYYRRGLFAMSIHQEPGLGTFATDEHWRMYYDPAKVEEWTIPELGAVWLHELEHLVRKHGERFRDTSDSLTNAQLWNVAADAGINTDIKEMGVLLPNPEARYYSTQQHYPGWERGQTTESLYEIAKHYEKGNDDEDQGQGKPDNSTQDKGEQESQPQDSQDSQSGKDENNDSSSDDSQSSEDSSDSQDDSQDPQEGESDSGTGEQGKEDPDEGDSSSQGSSSEDTDDEEADSDDQSSSSSGNSSNSEAEDQEDSSSSDSSNSDGDSGDSGKDPSNASGASNSDSSATGELGDDDTPESPSVSNPEPFCGSGADGMPREYDKGEDPEDGSLNNYQADKLRKEVAHDILEQEKTSPGSVPGGLLREAGIILSPQVNWKREISRDLRMFAAYWAGQDVSTYNRASRRSQKGIIFPGKVAVKPPEVSVVLDTSGSMGKKDLGFVLGQVDAMMKRIKSMSPLPTIKIINCDVATTEITEVSNVKQIELVGGGGTDMRVGIKAAAEQRDTPDLIITATDGFTPFPREPVYPALKTKYIVLIVTKELVTDKLRKRFESMIPSFMKTIYVSTKGTTL